MKFVAVKNQQYGHATEAQKLFLQTLHGDRRYGPVTRKERRIARAKAREQMFGEKEKFEIPEVTNLVTKNG